MFVVSSSHMKTGHQKVEPDRVQYSIALILPNMSLELAGSEVQGRQANDKL